MSSEISRQTRENKLPASIKLVGGSAISFETSYVEVKKHEETAAANKARAAAYENMKELAMRDSLTGLYTRRAFADEYERIANTVRRHHIDNKIPPTSATLLLLDIDHFKQVNDTRGHDAGDEVLTSVGLILQAGTRRSDAVARWGGEEMAVLLEETDIDGGMQAAENLRTLIEESPSGVTASFGAVEIDPNLTINENMAMADRALYLAKQNGRNQVVRFDPLMPAKPGV